MSNPLSCPHCGSENVLKPNDKIWKCGDCHGTARPNGFADPLASVPRFPGDNGYSSGRVSRCPAAE